MHGFVRSSIDKKAYKISRALEQEVSRSSEVEKVINITRKADKVTIWKYASSEKHLGRFNHVYEYASSSS